MKRKYKKEEGNRKESSRGGDREAQAFQVLGNTPTFPKQLDLLGGCLAPLPCFMSQHFV